MNFRGPGGINSFEVFFKYYPTFLLPSLPILKYFLVECFRNIIQSDTLQQNADKAEHYCHVQGSRVYDTFYHNIFSIE